jgi:hypothetical protein
LIDIKQEYEGRKEGRQIRQEKKKKHREDEEGLGGNEVNCNILFSAPIQSSA